MQRAYSRCPSPSLFFIYFCCISGRLPVCANLHKVLRLESLNPGLSSHVFNETNPKRKFRTASFLFSRFVDPPSAVNIVTLYIQPIPLFHPPWWVTHAFFFRFLTQSLPSILNRKGQIFLPALATPCGSLNDVINVRKLAVNVSRLPFNMIPCRNT
jgi:hypothetical protein